MKTKNVNVKFFGRFLNSVFEKESKKVTNNAEGGRKLVSEAFVECKQISLKMGTFPESFVWLDFYTWSILTGIG